MRITPVDESDRPVTPKNCSVLVNRRGEWRPSLRYNCHEWFVPPVGWYTAWVEAEDVISPLIVFSYGGGGRPARSLVPLTPAGRVRVSMERALRPDETIRLIALQGGPRPFGRRVTGAEASEGVRMPAGPIIAGVFRGEDAIALSRPVTVTAGTVTSVPLEPPQQASVLAILQHPRLGERLELLLESDGRRLLPDVRLDATTLTYGIWYELQPRAVRLLVGGGTDLVSEPLHIDLLRGDVKTLRQTISSTGKHGKENER